MVKEGRVHKEPQLALSIGVQDRPGILAALASEIYRHGANVTYVGMDVREGEQARIFFELEAVDDEKELLAALEAVENVLAVSREPTFHKIFGRRIIVIGAGAQVGAVVMGAVSEADRHNIRGERISVDTIPLVGEAEIAEALRATARLPRVEAVVLAGSLMGGDITNAVREVRDKGILVVSLNMAGSVPGAADLVVSDPQQAGVMTVMLVASTAKLDINRIRGRHY